MYNVYYYDFPIVTLGIVDNGKAIVAITLKEELEKYSIPMKETELIKEAHQQLTEYFSHQRTTFDLPLEPLGTEFQKKCWHMLQSIPYGSTWTYQQLASALNNPKACRAVGNANHKNPIMIVIPCHRVIGVNGKLTGYRGGIHLKEKLLLLEKMNH